MRKVLMIAIAGGVACGKTTISSLLCQSLLSKGYCCNLVEMDSYYKNIKYIVIHHNKFTRDYDRNLNCISNYDFDVPNAIDFDLAYTQLREIALRRTVHVPRYNFFVSKREENEFKMVESTDIIIFEGIYALYDNKILPMLEVKVFLDSEDYDIRLQRKIQRDMTTRGRTAERAIHQYKTFAIPAYKNYIKPTIINADLIINTDIITIENSVKAITSYLKKRTMLNLI